MCASVVNSAMHMAGVFGDFYRSPSLFRRTRGGKLGVYARLEDCMLCIMQFSQLHHCEEELKTQDTFVKLADKKAGGVPESTVVTAFLDMICRATQRNHKKRCGMDTVSVHIQCVWHTNVNRWPVLFFKVISKLDECA